LQATTSAAKETTILTRCWNRFRPAGMETSQAATFEGSVPFGSFGGRLRFE
jgi:hypothetical protein